MANAIILYGGYIKRSTNLDKLEFSHRSGFLTKFAIKGTSLKETVYTHVNKADLNANDRNIKKLSAGYYKEEEYLKYISGQITPQELPQHILDFGLLDNPILGDKIKIRKLKVIFPYTDISVSVINWDYTPGADIVDTNSEIIIPANAISQEEPIPLHPVAKGFYDQNISLITDAASQIVNKDEGAYLLVLTTLQINRIEKNIFPLFNNDVDFSGYITSQNEEWSSTKSFVKPTLVDIQNYFNEITSFYNSLYTNQILIKQAKDETKLYWLAYVLSAKGLAVVPVSDKIELLKYIAKGTILERSRLSEILSLNPVYKFLLPSIIDEEYLVLKILESVTLNLTQCDVFLEFLLKIYFNNTQKGSTFFEVLYSKIDDNRMSRYPSLGSDSDNRKKYIKTLYSIWETSKYNPLYNSPSYTIPANEYGVYPQSFFMTPSGQLKYNQYTSPPVFEYESNGDAWRQYSATFDFELDGITISAQRITEETYISGELVQTDKEYEEYGTYHLYQPVAVLGYKPDPDLKADMPKENRFPIFFLYYTNDYDELKNLDFGVTAIIEVALNFLFIGELSTLRYLKYLSPMGRLTSLPAEELVLNWTAVQDVNEAIQFTAGNALVLSNYLNNTSSDENIIRLTQKINIFLAVITIGSLVAKKYTKARVIAAADDVTREIDNLTKNGIAHNLPSDVVNAIRKIGNNTNQLISLTRNKIISIPNAQGLLSRFEALNNTKKFDFYKDFYDSKPIIFQGLELSGGSLFYVWNDVEFLIVHKKDLIFLRAVRRIYLEPRIDNHILKLDISIKATKGIKVTGGHHLPSMLANLESGYEIEYEVVQNLLLGFKKMRIKVKIPGYSLKTKGVSTMLPEFWTSKRIKEECAFALFKAGNPIIVDPVTNRLSVISFLSNGVRVKILLYKNNAGIININNILFFEY